MYHYVYRITNIEKRKYYYGVRSSNSVPWKDIGVKYFSLSLDKEFNSNKNDIITRSTILDKRDYKANKRDIGTGY